MEVSEKTQNRTTYDLAMPLLGIYMKETKTLIQKDTCTSAFISRIIYNCQDMEAT